jgi:hypothetical protein
MVHTQNRGRDEMTKRPGSKIVRGIVWYWSETLQRYVTIPE